MSLFCKIIKTILSGLHIPSSVLKFTYNIAMVTNHFNKLRHDLKNSKCYMIAIAIIIKQMKKTKTIGNYIIIKIYALLVCLTIVFPM